MVLYIRFALETYDFLRILGFNQFVACTKFENVSFNILGKEILFYLKQIFYNIFTRLLKPGGNLVCTKKKITHNHLEMFIWC